MSEWILLLRGASSFQDFVAVANRWKHQVYTAKDDPDFDENVDEAGEAPPKPVAKGKSEERPAKKAKVAGAEADKSEVHPAKNAKAPKVPEKDVKKKRMAKSVAAESAPATKGHPQADPCEDSSLLALAGALSQAVTGEAPVEKALDTLAASAEDETTIPEDLTSLDGWQAPTAQKDIQTALDDLAAVPISSSTTDARLEVLQKICALGSCRCALPKGQTVTEHHGEYGRTNIIGRFIREHKQDKEEERVAKASKPGGVVFRPESLVLFNNTTDLYIVDSMAEKAGKFHRYTDALDVEEDDTTGRLWCRKLKLLDGSELRKDKRFTHSIELGFVRSGVKRLDVEDAILICDLPKDTTARISPEEQYLSGFAEGADATETDKAMLLIFLLHGKFLHYKYELPLTTVTLLRALLELDPTAMPKKFRQGMREDKCAFAALFDKKKNDAAVVEAVEKVEAHFKLL